MHLGIAVLFLSLDLTSTDIPISKDRQQRERHRESPQRKAQDHLVLIGPVCSSNSIRNGATNRLPRPENASSPSDIAIALRTLDLSHQPVNVRLQDLVKEFEAQVDGESGVEECAVADVEGGRFGH